MPRRIHGKPKRRASEFEDPSREFRRSQLVNLVWSDTLPDHKHRHGLTNLLSIPSDCRFNRCMKTAHDRDTRHPFATLLQKFVFVTLPTHVTRIQVHPQSAQAYERTRQNRTEIRVRIRRQEIIRPTTILARCKSRCPACA